MPSIKEVAINEVIRVEGGYVNNPNDSGGETKYGVTVAVARQYGYKGSMRNLPVELAFKIYEDRYWNALNLSSIESLSPLIAKELVDTAINMGVGRAGEFLQRSLNVLNNQQSLWKDLKVDGQIGLITIGYLKTFLIQRKDGASILYNMLNCLQGAFYIELAERRQKDEEFIYGWFKNRIGVTV